MRNPRRRNAFQAVIVALLGAVLAASAALAGGVVLAPTAGAASTAPPWEPDANSVGGLLFFDAAGNQITGGNVTDQPVAAYVEGTAVINPVNLKATLFAALPVPATPPNPATWTTTQVSQSTSYPNASAPGALGGTNPLPLVTGGATDLTVAGIEAALPNTSGAYANLYQLRVKTTGNGASQTTYDSADIQVTGSTWSVIYPVATSTVLTASPTGSQVSGAPVTLSATLTPSAATGTVQFEDGSTPIGSVQTVTSGVASVQTSTLPLGTDSLTAVFTPSTGSTYLTSTGTLSYSITSPPAISSVTPSSGPTAGGNSVVIGGTDLTGATSVTIGGTNAPITANTATSITVTAPSGTAGPADVVVDFPSSSPVTDTGGYTYVVAPTIGSVTPDAGPVAGGNSVVIGGTNLSGATSVTVGGTNAPITADTTTSITVTAPSGTAGPANVVVTTAGGPVTDTGGYTYQSAPTITSVVPNTGSVAGGDSVVVNGTNLLGASVKFGGAAATVVTDTGTAVTVTTPVGTVGPAAVAVTTSSGQVTDTGGFTYLAGPAITSVIPDAGPLGGGNTVVINGSSLATATSVTIGGTPATNVVATSTSITVTAPSGTAGPADVVAHFPGAVTVTVTGGYTFEAAPVVTTVTPSSGPLAAGNTVAIAGSNLLAATVTIGGTAATVTADTSTSITVTAPSGAAGPADVVVTTPSGSTTKTGGYTFVAAPIIGSVTPNAGPVAGGNSVVIGGTNLTGATSVTIGGTAATVTADTSTSITVTAPSGTAGPANVVVTTAGGPVTDTGGYTYQSAPIVASVMPDAGPLTAGATVVIGGTSLANASSVTIGGAAATVTADSSTSITVTAPSGTAGPADVVVTTPGGTVTSSGAYTYVAAPVVTTVTPNNGGALGGTSVVIGGSNLANVSSVTIGGAAATIVSDAAGSITVTTPSTDTAGPADVVVTTAGGATTKTGGFTFTASPPAPPVVNEVTPGDGSATVSWTPGPTGGTPILSYTAYATPLLASAPLLAAGTLSCTVSAPSTSCTITGLVNGTTYDFSVVATNAQGSGQASNTVPATPATRGGGGATTPSGKGYWLAAADGGVFAYGDAGFYGSTGGQHLNAPVVGFSSTFDGKGYWLVAADGGVFAYGDAGFYGSTGGQHLNAPIVNVSSTADGKGYWLVAADGGVFAYGDAGFYGSASGLPITAPIVGSASTSDGNGYWLFSADGGVFAYGDAVYFGSAAGLALTAPIV